MVCCGVVWCGVLWCDVVWCGGWVGAGNNAWLTAIGTDACGRSLASAFESKLLTPIDFSCPVACGSGRACWGSGGGGEASLTQVEGACISSSAFHVPTQSIPTEAWMSIRSCKWWDLSPVRKLRRQHNRVKSVRVRQLRIYNERRAEPTQVRLDKFLCEESTHAGRDLRSDKDTLSYDTRRGDSRRYFLLVKVHISRVNATPERERAAELETHVSDVL